MLISVQENLLGAVLDIQFLLSWVRVIWFALLYFELFVFY